MRALAMSIVLGIVGSAQADEIGPNDHLCTLEVQQRDGSRCEVCYRSVQDHMNGGVDPCAPLIERGWTQRCAIGATHSTHVFCDRPGDFVAVGSGGGCGCRTANGGSPGSAWPLAALLLLGIRRYLMP